MKILQLATAALLGAALLVAGCRRDDVLFVNPNTPTTATPPTLLTALEVSTMNTYEGELTRVASILVQHNAGVDFQALDPQVYTLQEGSFENQWAQVYQALQTGKELIDRFGTGNPHYRGMTKVLMAMNWGIATDCFGDIPYTEALQVNTNLYPKYDAQQTVIAGILTMLDEAITDLGNDDNTVLPGGADVIFGGNAEAWTRTAYTLKARYLLRYSNKAGQYQPNAILNALSNGISGNSENCLAIHGPLGNEVNQWYAFQNARAGYIQAHETLVNALIGTDTGDLRLFYYFDSSSFDNIVVGAPVDLSSGDPSYSPWGEYLAGSEATPTPLVTYMEAKFIEAEVRARSGDATGASSALNDAIRASADFSTGGAYDGANIAGYTLATTTVEAVMTEKWKAMFGQVEAYNDYRRTGFPVLTPNPNGTLPSIPARYPTPRNERVGNPNAPQPALTDKVWWATP